MHMRRRSATAWTWRKHTGTRQRWWIWKLGAKDNGFVRVTFGGKTKEKLGVLEVPVPLPRQTLCCKMGMCVWCFVLPLDVFILLPAWRVLQDKSVLFNGPSSWSMLPLGKAAERGRKCGAVLDALRFTHRLKSLLPFGCSSSTCFLPCSLGTNQLVPLCLGHPPTYSARGLAMEVHRTSNRKPCLLARSPAIIPSQKIRHSRSPGTGFCTLWTAWPPGSDVAREGGS